MCEYCISQFADTLLTFCLSSPPPPLSGSLLTMVAFSLLSLFMALTLSSVSWIGMNASSYCQYVWDQCEANRTQTNGTVLPDVPFRLPIMKWAFELSSEGSATIDPDITSELCDDIEYHYLCGKLPFNECFTRSISCLNVGFGLIDFRHP